MQSCSQIVNTNKPTPRFLQAGCRSCHQTNSVREWKGIRQVVDDVLNMSGVYDNVCFDRRCFSNYIQQLQTICDPPPLSILVHVIMLCIHCILLDLLTSTSFGFFNWPPVFPEVTRGEAGCLKNFWGYLLPFLSCNKQSQSSK